MTNALKTGFYISTCRSKFTAANVLKKARGCRETIFCFPADTTSHIFYNNLSLHGVKQNKLKMPVS